MRGGMESDSSFVCRRRSYLVFHSERDGKMVFLALGGPRPLRGRIRNYRVARTTEAFFLSDFGRNATGLVTLAAAAVEAAGLMSPGVMTWRIAAQVGVLGSSR